MRVNRAGMQYGHSLSKNVLYEWKNEWKNTWIINDGRKERRKGNTRGEVKRRKRRRRREGKRKEKKEGKKREKKRYYEQKRREKNEARRGVKIWEEKRRDGRKEENVMALTTAISFAKEARKNQSSVMLSLAKTSSKVKQDDITINLWDSRISCKTPERQLKNTHCSLNLLPKDTIMLYTHLQAPTVTKLRHNADVWWRNTNSHKGIKILMR